MTHEKDDGITGECACFNSLYSAEKKVQGGNRKKNGVKYKGLLICSRGKGLEIYGSTPIRRKDIGFDRTGEEVS